MSDKSEYDITIIEINSEDYLYNKRFLDIDDNLNKSDDLLKEKYKNENIYLIHYPNIIESKYIPKISFGQIKSICEDNYNIEHSCGIDIGSSGSPILSSKNYKVVGIHLGKFENHSYKKGALLKIPIFKFNNIFKKISNDDIINTIYLNKYEEASYEVQNLLNISKTNVYSKYNNAKNCEIITFGDFSRVVKWYECSLRIEKIIKENIKSSVQKEYFFISSEWINKFETTFQYDQLKLHINDFKKYNENPLTKTQIEYLYYQIKDRFFISLEKKKMLIIPNNYILQKELYINEHFIIKFYYINFILIDKHTFEEFKKEYRILQPIKFDLLLGSGIFIITLNNAIEVGIFSDNIYQYEIFFFIFENLIEQKREKDKIIKEGISNYFHCYGLNKEQITVLNIRKSNGKEMIIINLRNYKSKEEISIEKKDFTNQLDISQKRGLAIFDNINCSKLNSIMQLITSIKEIKDYLFDENNKPDIVKYNHIYILSSTLIKIFEQLYIKETKNNYVEDLSIILNFINPGTGPTSIEQYFLFILDTLHNELNKSQFKKNNLISLESPLNYEEQTYNIFFIYYNDFYKSKIADNFNWIQKKNYICTKCYSSLYTLQAFRYIEFNLDDIYHYTIKQNSEYKKICNEYKDNKDLLIQKTKKLNVPMKITDCFKYYLSNIDSSKVTYNYCKQFE